MISFKIAYSPCIVSRINQSMFLIPNIKNASQISKIHTKYQKCIPNIKDGYQISKIHPSINNTLSQISKMDTKYQKYIPPLIIRYLKYQKWIPNIKNTSLH